MFADAIQEGITNSGHIRLPNSSGYMPAWIGKQIDADPNLGDWLLLTEPAGVIGRMEELSPRTWTKAEWSDGVDLNKAKAERTYNGILFLFALEHVWNPVAAMQWIADSLVVGARVYLTTTNVPESLLVHQYHGFPKDYHRWFRTWFEDLPEHLPLKLVALTEAEHENTIYAVYERV